MIVKTYTADQFTERIRIHGTSSLFGIPPVVRAASMLDEVAKQANALGKQGHGVKRVEIIETFDPMKTAHDVSIRLVPDFRLKPSGP